MYSAQKVNQVLNYLLLLGRVLWCRRRFVNVTDGLLSVLFERGCGGGGGLASPSAQLQGPGFVHEKTILRRWMHT